MINIGKIALTALILGLFLIFPAAAQNELEWNPPANQSQSVQTQPAQQRNTSWRRSDLQSIYIDHLRQEGYTPSIDADGDIQFKVSGENYFIIIDENDLQFFQVYMGFSLGATPPNAALNAANFSNRHSKVAKVSISSNGIVANITAELLLEDPRDFKPVLSRALSLIRNAENIFLTQLRQSQAL